MQRKTAIISGFGPGLSTSLMVRLVAENYTVIGLSRNTEYGQKVAREQPNLIPMACDMTQPDTLEKTFSQITEKHGDISLLIHNVAQLVLRDFLEIRLDEFDTVWRTICLSAVHATQLVLPGMLKNESGTIIFSGATASVKAGPKSAAFASAKFALRGLAQSLARAYGPQGIHIAHVILDGVIWGERAEKLFEMAESECMQADDIADTYMALIHQQPSSWTHELDLRPYKEQF